MKINMSPEAVTNRLKTMEQLWELSVELMKAQEISETASSSEKSLAENRNGEDGKIIYGNLRKF